MGSVIPLKKSANSAYLELKNLIGFKSQNPRKIKKNKSKFLSISVRKKILNLYPKKLYLSDKKKV